MWMKDLEAHFEFLTLDQFKCEIQRGWDCSAEIVRHFLFCVSAHWQQSAPGGSFMQIQPVINVLYLRGEGKQNQLMTFDKWAPSEPAQENKLLWSFGFW